MTTTPSRGQAADRGRELLSRLEIGSRITLRSLLPSGSATDAVGELVDRDDTSVTVRTRRRGDVVVGLADVVAARRIG